MTDRRDAPELAEIAEKLWQDVLDVIDSLVNPAPLSPQPVPVPIRKGPRRG